MENKDKKIEIQELINVKLVFFHLIKKWKWYLFFLLLSLWIAHEYNKRQQNIYELDTLISVKDEQNPFFTSNMSLIFNWGGPSDKVNTIMTIFKSRRHNEKVVRKLKLYIQYYKQGKYYPVDLYGKAPFEVKPRPNTFQALGIPFKIKILSPEKFKLSYEINKKTDRIKLFNYDTEESRVAEVTPELRKFEGEFRFGEEIDLPVFHGTIEKVPGRKYSPDEEYYFRFKGFYGTVNSFRRLNVSNFKKNSSMIQLKKRGKNPLKIQDYLNTSVRILQEKLLRDKNSFATNTLRFIDSTLQYLKQDLQQSNRRLQEFQRNKAEFALDNPSENLYSQLVELDKEKSVLEAQKLYYQSLLEYINNDNLSKIPSPSIVGITDPLIIENTRKLTELAIQKEQMNQIMNPNSMVMNELEEQINNVKQVLRNSTQSALWNLTKQLSFVQQKINRLERKLNRLPSELKQFIDLKREYEIKDQIYSYLLQKRNEVNIVKASNQSNLKILDEAKYTGQAPIAPKKKINYITALLLALFLPTLFFVLKFFNDDTIQDETQVKKITPVKIVGTIFHYDGKDAMPVLHESVGSRMREAFSILRTNIRLMLPSKKDEAKTVLVTSTMSGEGKTFVSSNLAAINAMSKQKTVLLEFDIRKPKAYQYFNLDKNRPGLVDYIENKNLELDKVILPTGIENLDIILAGKDAPDIKKEIAGLLEDQRVEELMRELKKRYDYIFIDTPPIGLVPDTLILNQYADLMLYLVREGLSKRSYLYILNEYLNNRLIKNVGIVYNNYKLDLIKKYVYQSKYSYAYTKDGYKIYSTQKRNIPGTLRRKIKHLLKNIWKIKLP